MVLKKDQVGRLERIWVKQSTGNPIDARKNVLLVTGQGLKGNLHQGGKRQITPYLDQSDREKMILELGGVHGEVITGGAIQVGDHVCGEG